MNTNEKIARWLGGIEVERWHEDPKEGDVYRWEDGSIRVVNPHGMSPLTRPWQPDTDITLWHGSGSLLDEIERRELRMRFIRRLWDIARMAYPGQWARTENVAWWCLVATPAQLAAALEAVIDDE